MPETITIDLRDRIDELESDINEVDDELDAVREEAASLHDVDEESEDVDVEEEYDRLEREYDDLEDLRDELRSQKETIGEKIESYGGSEFKAKRLSWGDKNEVDDLVRAKALDDNQEDPRAKLGAYKVWYTQVATVSTPPDAPEKAHGFPPAVGDYLYREIDTFNRRGETNLQSSGLRQHVSPPDSTQN